MSLLRAALFDKDGTLIDFHRSWDIAVGVGLEAAAPDEGALAAAAAAIEYDLETRTIGPASVFVAESNEVIFETLAPHVDVDAFGRACMQAADQSTVAADGLPDLLHTLLERNVRLGVATNDWHEIASDQLDLLGWTDLFEVVMGANSGFGAKPDPGMLLEAARRLDASPAETLMVGDTAHDLHAGRAAGMTTVLVTGSSGATATPETIGLADIVVHSLADLEAELVASGYLSV